MSPFGIVSLVLTLPGVLLSAFITLNWHILHWKAVVTATEALGYLGTVLVVLLPFLGFCAGVVGWRSLSGKLGIAASVLNYGIVFAEMWWIDPL